MDNWINYIKEHPECPWDKGFISANPNVTWDMVEENPWFLWCYNRS